MSDERLLTPDWDVPDWVRSWVTTNAVGASAGAFASNNLATHVGDAPAAVAANRHALATGTRLTRVQWLTQVHGIEVIEAGFATLAGAPEADAMWTREPGVALAILTADCLPVLLVDRLTRVVGAAHAGWRGLDAGVLGALVRAMPSASEALCAWIGPAIGARCYEVGPEVWGRFESIEDALRPGRGDASKRLLDLAAVAEYQLTALGVRSVTCSNLCTYHDGRFYSHRAHQHDVRAQGETTGRFATLVAIDAGLV